MKGDRKQHCTCNEEVVPISIHSLNGTPVSVICVLQHHLERDGDLLVAPYYDLLLT